MTSLKGKRKEFALESKFFPLNIALLVERLPYQAKGNMLLKLHPLLKGQVNHGVYIYTLKGVFVVQITTMDNLTL